MSDHPSRRSLDPEDDWTALRRQGHAMLDDMFDYLQQLRARPVWQPAPDDIRRRFQQALPQQPTPLAEVHQRFLTEILPYVAGNAHPGFMGWVHGGGTPVGMLAEMLAGGLNVNVGGRNQMPVEVERQITRWMRELFEFPHTASGVFVTGTSMANLMSVLVARAERCGPSVRQTGVPPELRLTAYTSQAAHGCIAQAMDLSGLGAAALRRIGLTPDHQMDLAALRQAITDDRAAGCTPLMIIGTAGSVDVGAIDDVQSLAAIAAAEELWFHIDGAFGALARLAPALAPLLAGIEQADSIAFDFHKWGQVPYDAGFLLVRDGSKHLAAFAAPAAYLRRESRGLAAGSPWPCDFGPDLSRGFRALKTWFTFQVYGTAQLGETIHSSCQLAQYLVQQIALHSALERLAPVALNIVCFRYRVDGLDVDALNQLNAEIVADLHESGLAAPSTTTLHGQLAIRAALVNHRTDYCDIDQLMAAVLRFGKARTHSG